MDQLPVDIQEAVIAIGKIPVVPTILEVICRTTGMGFAAVARVTDKHWVACAVQDEIQFGLVPGGELKLETTICHEIRQHQQSVVIDNVVQDPIYASHHTPLQYGFQSYISIPIRKKDGTFFGTLCAIDPRPARLKNPETIGMFTLYAELIALHLDAVDQLSITQYRLEEERKESELREQFIAILGHDLRNPVGAVLNSGQLLLRLPQTDQQTKLATIITDAARRMDGLIENVLDFARGRMGGGLTIRRSGASDLTTVLEQVIAELRQVWPDRIITTEYNLAAHVNADQKRIAQLFSNLLGNALTHGNPAMPIGITACSAEGAFELCVTNQGTPIPAGITERMFEPFFRGADTPGKKGLGLGLYIAAEIARAHGGILTVTSTEKKTCFQLLIPNEVGG